MQENIRPLPGVFTVNDSGKKVQFAPGNLFWDGKRFDIEENQYDFPLEWDPKHVGHFLWSKNAIVAIMFNSRDEGDAVVSENFFAAEGKAIEGWTVLSKDEWDYMFKNHLGRHDVTIDSRPCLVLVPDGVEASVVKDCYSSSKWAEAEKTYGLVALPCAGSRFTDSINLAGIFGYYWSSSSDSKDEAWIASFGDDEDIEIYVNDHCEYYSVRLVSIIDPSNKPDITNRNTDSNPLVLEPVDLSKASFGERFLTRSGEKAVLVGKQDNGEFYLVAVENSIGRDPMSVCRDGFFRWNLKGQSQYKTPTERKEKGGLDVVHKGWDDDVAAALRKEYNEHSQEEFAKYLNEKK